MLACNTYACSQWTGEILQNTSFVIDFSFLVNQGFYSVIHSYFLSITDDADELFLIIHNMDGQMLRNSKVIILVFYLSIIHKCCGGTSRHGIIRLVFPNFFARFIWNMYQFFKNTIMEIWFSCCSCPCLTGKDQRRSHSSLL